MTEFLAQSKHIFISTGEASGDVLAAGLVKNLRSINPQLKITAMGSNALQAAGAEILIDSSQVAVVGFWEIVTHFKQIWQAMQQIKKTLRTQKPDLIVLVDYPGFNLRVAKIAADLKIPVFYYVSPQIWAWRYGRIKRIKKTVQHMAVLFPFEEEIYKKENIPVTFVGHPLTDICKTNKTATEIYSALNLNPKQPIIALFPGSRSHEIKYLLPIMLKTIPLIRERIPEVQFVLPLAKNLTIEEIEHYFRFYKVEFRTVNSNNLTSMENAHKILLIQDHINDLLSISSAAISASGTVTLEIALHQVPQVVIYRVSWLSAIIIKSLIRIKNIGLCNIIANELIAKELLQWRATPTAITNEIIALVTNITYRNNILQKIKKMKEKLGYGPVSQKAAEAVLRELEG